VKLKTHAALKGDDPDSLKAVLPFTQIRHEPMIRWFKIV
jgi:hypothetical protein